MEGTLEVVEVDVDQETALTDFYTIEATPTFILLRKGQQLWRQSGELTLERLERAVKGLNPENKFWVGRISNLPS